MDASWILIVALVGLLVVALLVITVIVVAVSSTKRRDK